MRTRHEYFSENRDELHTVAFFASKLFDLNGSRVTGVGFCSGFVFVSSRTRSSAVLRHAAGAVEIFFSFIKLTMRQHNITCYCKVLFT